MNSCFKIVLFLYFSFSRRPRALADVFEKNEQKNKTTFMYRLIVLKTTGFYYFQVSKTIILHTYRLVRFWLSSFKTFTYAYFF